MNTSISVLCVPNRNIYRGLERQFETTKTQERPRWWLWFRPDRFPYGSVGPPLRNGFVSYGSSCADGHATMYFLNSSPSFLSTLVSVSATSKVILIFIIKIGPVLLPPEPEVRSGWDASLGNQRATTCRHGLRSIETRCSCRQRSMFVSSFCG
jgi:hypothetical protein